MAPRSPEVSRQEASHNAFHLGQQEQGQKVCTSKYVSVYVSCVCVCVCCHFQIETLLCPPSLSIITFSLFIYANAK